MQFAVFVLRVSALAFLGIGLAFLVAPSAMAARVGVSLAGVVADNDVRAVYGGLQIACGVLLWVFSSRARWVHVGLYVQLVLFSGLALGRFVSWAAAGWPDPLALGLHAAEGIAIGCGVWSLSRLPAAVAPPE